MAHETPFTVITIIGWEKENPRLDMRIWLQTADGPRPGQGITLNSKEAITALDALQAIFATS